MLFCGIIISKIRINDIELTHLNNFVIEIKKILLKKKFSDEYQFDKCIIVSRLFHAYLKIVTSIRNKKSKRNRKLF